MTGHEVRASAAGSWRLGDVSVHRVGLGAMRLAGDGSAGARERAVALVRRAVELGVDHVDTAAFYPALPGGDGDGFTWLRWANEVVGEALAPLRDEVVVATKVGPTDGGLARPDQLRGLVETDLRSLRRDHLDLVYLRQHGLESVTAHWEVLAGLREEGLVRHLGLSNVRAHHLAQAQAVAPVAAVQNRYGVDFGRVNDDLLRACGEQGIAFVPFFALAGERRETGGVAGNDAVAAVCRRHGASPAQVRLAWTLARGPHVLAIPGTGDPRHLAENVAAGSLRLSAEELAALG